MTKYVDRTQRYHTTIREILIREWDPIAIFDVPEAQDEYDSYIPHIYSQLIHHKSKQEIFNYLWEIETDHISLYGNRQRAERVVKLLMQIPDAIEKNC